MRFSIPKNTQYVLDTLQSSGHEAYIVGGCVRDLLCGKEPHDFDITTSALPHEVSALFEKTVDTGIKHGTVTVIIGNTPIEVTTFRTEGEYVGHRRPDSVAFVGEVNEDLSRRDFTVNAMCYNHNEGIVDLFGGKADIENRILRAVGDPHKRFCEDALRILRLYRFSATLGFSIEESTLSAAIDCAPLLKSISAERIFAELKKAVLGENILILNTLLGSGALSHLNIKGLLEDDFLLLPAREDLRLFAFLSATSDNLPDTLKKLKCSNKFYSYCSVLSSLKPPQSAYEIKQILKVADFSVFCDFVDLMGIDQSIKESAKSIIDNGEPYKISHLCLSGNDILALGYTGAQVGEKLEYLLECVMKEPALNTKGKLTELLSN